ncbi:paraneoplastic antigen-like protein 8B, partial [Orycteropus afer afer]|uniref:Paraneoplastic antigen-like protein 8B n=1 Tax=Orycteropus afer afer TaxID=1230840 RepID=A0AC54Z714_ORYAF
TPTPPAPETQAQEAGQAARKAERPPRAAGTARRGRRGRGSRARGHRLTETGKKRGRGGRPLTSAKKDRISVSNMVALMAIRDTPDEMPKGSDKSENERPPSHRGWHEELQGRGHRSTHSASNAQARHETLKIESLGWNNRTGVLPDVLEKAWECGKFKYVKGNLCEFAAVLAAWEIRTLTKNKSEAAATGADEECEGAGEMVS